MAFKLFPLASLAVVTLAPRAFATNIPVAAATQSDIEYAVECASPGDVLVFPVGTVTFESQISTEKNLALRGASSDGLPATTLTKTAPCRFFEFLQDGGDERGIENLQFIGESSLWVADSGGALSVNGNFREDIKNSIFSENHSSGAGGAACIHNFDGHIKGSEFSENSAITYGGAICVGSFVETIENSFFSGNTAGVGGGAIFAENFEANIENLKFSDNHSSGAGGAACIHNFDGHIKGSEFSENSAITYGGAIYAESFFGTIESSSFIKNTAGVAGGAIFVENYFEGNMQNSIFSGNSSNDAGGAAHICNFNGHINGSEFSTNSAVGPGGAIHVTESFFGGIESSTFSVNSSGSSGGAILARKISGDIESSIFFTNSAIISGGAICVESFVGTIESSSFSGNTAGVDGGAIFAGNYFEGNIGNSQFFGNHSSGSGGAVYAKALTGTVWNSFFAVNSSNGAGGALYAFDATEGIESSIFLGNSANFGGAVAIANFDGNIENSFFGGNHSTGQAGGVIAAYKFSGNIEGSAFFENHSENGPGGAVAVSVFKGDIGNSIFYGNNGATHGGALTVEYIGGTASRSFSDLGGSRFLSNVAGSSGGAIFVSQNCYFAALSDDVIFQGNQVDTQSNAIFFNNALTNGTFSLAAAAGRTFYLYDPISSANSSSHKSLTLEINPALEHRGTVLLDQHRSALYFQSQSGATVRHGTLALHNGASFGASDNSGTFTLCPEATLRIACEQKTRTFSCTSGESGGYAVSESTHVPTYTRESAMGEIAAGTINLHGKLHFVLPYNVAANTVLLQMENGLVNIGGVEVQMEQSRPSFSVNLGESLVLINAESLIGVPQNHLCGEKNVDWGSILMKSFVLSTTHSQLLATLTLAPSPRAAALSAGQRHPIMLLNRCGDLIADGAMATAIARRSTPKRFVEFTALDFAAERYKSDCQTELRDRKLLTGFAISGGGATLHWAAGSFFPCGSASCKSCTDLGSGIAVTGASKIKFLGGGVLFRAAAAGKSGSVYVEAAACCGNARNSWHSDDLRDRNGQVAAYDGTFPCGETHGTVGYVRAGGKVSLDFHGKYFSSRLGGKSLTLSTGERVDFRAVQSNRLRIGARLSFPGSDHFTPYGALAWEREFGSGTDIGVYNIAVSPLSFAGSCTMGEIGFAFKSAAVQPLTIDLGVCGTFGDRWSINGTLRAGLEF